MAAANNSGAVVTDQPTNIPPAHADIREHATALQPRDIARVKACLEREAMRAVTDQERGVSTVKCEALFAQNRQRYFRAIVARHQHFGDFQFRRAFRAHVGHQTTVLRFATGGD